MEYVFKNEPNCKFNKFCSCDPSYSRRTITCSINVDILLHEDLQHIQSAIDDIKEIRSKCRTCDTEYQVLYEKHDIIDTSTFSPITRILQDA